MDIVIPPRLRNLKNHRHPCRRKMRYNVSPRHMSVGLSPAASAPHAELPLEITQVWASNLFEEFVKIQWALHNGYGVVALDTEFPGTPYIPDGVSSDYRNRSSDDHYAVLKLNVERTKIIQVGLTLTDEFGNLPHFGSGKRVLWEFNFCDFDADSDVCDKDSIALLGRNGIDFERHKKYGISSASFAKLMVWSGLIGRSQAWITFQGGVDFAYLLKMILMNGVLPSDLASFKACISMFFGQCVFDVKHIMTSCSLYGGLEKVATTLKVNREAGQSHQASSDSLLTSRVFQRIGQLYFQQPQDLNSFAGKLHNYV